MNNELIRALKPILDATKGLIECIGSNQADIPPYLKVKLDGHINNVVGSCRDFMEIVEARRYEA